MDSLLLRLALVAAIATAGAGSSCHTAAPSTNLRLAGGEMQISRTGSSESRIPGLHSCSARDCLANSSFGARDGLSCSRHVRAAAQGDAGWPRTRDAVELAALTARECDSWLKIQPWSAGKPGDGPHGYLSNPWSFREDNSFVTLRDGFTGTWHCSPDATAPGKVILRMDWLGRFKGHWAEFELQLPGLSPAFWPRASSFDFMLDWGLVLRVGTPDPDDSDTAAYTPAGCTSTVYRARAVSRSGEQSSRDLSCPPEREAHEGFGAVEHGSQWKGGSMAGVDQQRLKEQRGVSVVPERRGETAMEQRGEARTCTELTQGGTSSSSMALIAGSVSSTKNLTDKTMTAETSVVSTSSGERDRPDQMEEPVRPCIGVAFRPSFATISGVVGHSACLSSQLAGSVGAMGLGTTRIFRGLATLEQPRAYRRASGMGKLLAEQFGAWRRVAQGHAQGVWTDLLLGWDAVLSSSLGQRVQHACQGSDTGRVGARQQLGSLRAAAPVLLALLAARLLAWLAAECGGVGALVTALGPLWPQEARYRALRPRWRVAVPGRR